MSYIGNYNQYLEHMKEVNPITDKQIEEHRQTVRTTLHKQKAFKTTMQVGGVMAVLSLLICAVLVLGWYIFLGIISLIAFNYIFYVLLLQLYKRR